MPTSCVVGGCTRNSLKNPEIHFVQFPRDPAISREWVKFVTFTRQDFTFSARSRPLICSAHFSEDCTEPSSALKISLGLTSKFRLKPGSIPTLKAPNIEVSGPKSTTSATASTTTSAESSASSTGSARSRKRQSGAAFQKRERSRVLEEAFAEYESKHGGMQRPPLRGDSSSSSSDEDLPDPEAFTGDLEASTNQKDVTTAETSSQTNMDQTTQTVSRHRCAIDLDVSKTNYHPKDTSSKFIRSKKTQTNRKMFHPVNKGVQACPRHVRHHKSTECSLVKGKPLTKLHAHGIQPTVTAVHEPQKDLAVLSDEPALDDVGQTEPESDYVPSSQDSDDTSSSSGDQGKVQPNVVEDTKYIVFGSSLLKLFSKCFKCNTPAKVKVGRPFSGTLVEVRQICRKRGCGQMVTWRSQPMIGNTAAGNLLLSSAILTSGCSPKKFLRALTTMNVATISYSTFSNHQKWYHQPAISGVWMTEQDALVKELRGKDGGIFLGTDMRADSMGHSAKFGCYNTLEMNVNKVLHIELVQKNECANKANLMEKEGLLRTLMWVDNQLLKISAIVTDRHRQIAKYLREELVPTGVKHYYDVWHVAKGLKKKLIKLSKLKECDVVRPWIHSITNNIYWVAASTPGGDQDLMLAKFDSVHNHLLNTHTHDNALFPRCAHGALQERQWLVPGTKAAQEVGKILGSVHLRKDIKMLSPSMQTSNVESFHAVINHFAPKMFVFSFEGILCRIYLAALHFNENAGRSQARTRKGDSRYTICYPRSKQDSGGYTVQKVLVNSTFDYAKKIMHKAVVLCQQHDKASRHLHPQLMCNPGPLAATFKRPERDAAVAGFVSRFAKVTKLVGRAQPPPDQEEPPGGSQTSVGRGKMTPGVQVKGKRRKEVEQHLPPKRTKRKTAKK